MIDSFFNRDSISVVDSGQNFIPTPPVLVAGSVHGASLGRPDIYIYKGTNPHKALSLHQTKFFIYNYIAVVVYYTLIIQ